MLPIIIYKKSPGAPYDAPASKVSFTQKAKELASRVASIFPRSAAERTSIRIQMEEFDEAFSSQSDELTADERAAFAENEDFSVTLYPEPSLVSKEAIPVQDAGYVPTKKSEGSLRKVTRFIKSLFQKKEPARGQVSRMPDLNDDPTVDPTVYNVLEDKPVAPKRLDTVKRVALAVAKILVNTLFRNPIHSIKKTYYELKFSYGMRKASEGLKQYLKETPERLQEQFLSAHLYEAPSFRPKHYSKEVLEHTPAQIQEEVEPRPTQESGDIDCIIIDSPKVEATKEEGEDDPHYAFSKKSLANQQEGVIYEPIAIEGLEDVDF